MGIYRVLLIQTINPSRLAGRRHLVLRGSPSGPPWRDGEVLPGLQRGQAERPREGRGPGQEALGLQREARLLRPVRPGEASRPVRVSGWASVNNAHCPCFLGINEGRGLISLSSLFSVDDCEKKSSTPIVCGSFSSRFLVRIGYEQERNGYPVFSSVNQVKYPDF